MHRQSVVRVGVRHSPRARRLTFWSKPIKSLWLVYIYASSAESVGEFIGFREAS
jgi:hypothetical protein